MQITEELTKPGEPGQGSDVIVNAKLFERNPNTPPEIFEFVESLPSFPPPDTLASPLRRAKAHLLAPPFLRSPLRRTPRLPW